MSNNEFKFKVGDILKCRVRYLPSRFSFYTVTSTQSGTYSSPEHRDSYCLSGDRLLTKLPFSKEFVERRYELCTTEEIVLAKLEGLI